VEFRAHYSRSRRSGDGAREEQKGFLHERSHFAVRARRWFYLDGELLG
jgi:SEC-C motif-containing protein